MYVLLGIVGAEGLVYGHMVAVVKSTKGGKGVESWEEAVSVDKLCFDMYIGWVDDRRWDG